MSFVLANQFSEPANSQFGFKWALAITEQVWGRKEFLRMLYIDKLLFPGVTVIKTEQNMIMFNNFEVTLWHFNMCW